jgi:transcriptional regulator with XRE-family HTH domain
MNIDKRKKNLIKKLRNKKYREAFVSEHIDTGIPFQIRALRNQRKWKQIDLAKHAEMKQERISLLEDPNYSKFTLATLKKLASAFNVGLIVRFVPISDLVEWELGLTSDSLKAVSFDQDDYFKERPEGISPIPQAIATKASTEVKEVDTEATEAIKEDFLGTATVSFLTLPEAIPDNRKFVQANILGF